MNRHIRSINALHTAYGDALGFVLILIPRLPECLRGAICKTADHGRPAGCSDVHYTGQVLQTGHHTQIL